MGRARRERARQTTEAARSRQRKQRALILAGSVAAGLVAVGVVASVQGGGGLHPEPRVEIPPDHVMPATRYAQYPRVAQTYEMAAAVPQVLDGLYCHCDCSEHSGHYSLLDCFASDHAARCDVCMSEAVIGYEMAREGATLDAIRAEIDRVYGS